MILINIHFHDIRKIQILLHVSNKCPGHFEYFEKFYKWGILKACPPPGWTKDSMKNLSILDVY